MSIPGNSVHDSLEHCGKTGKHVKRSPAAAAVAAKRSFCGFIT